jgi:hypothetical protein
VTSRGLAQPHNGWTANLQRFHIENICVRRRQPAKDNRPLHVASYPVTDTRNGLEGNQLRKRVAGYGHLMGAAGAMIPCIPPTHDRAPITADPLEAIGACLRLVRRRGTGQTGVT